MRALLKPMLIAAALAAAPSCASRVETRPAFPSAADLTVEPEPAYPLAALESVMTPDGRVVSTPAAMAAEDAWNDRVLIWGREGWASVARLCRWAAAHGMHIDCPEATR